MSSVALGIASLKRHTALLKPHIQSAFLPDLQLTELDNIARSELQNAGLEEEAINPLLESIETEEGQWAMTFRMKSPEGRGRGITVSEWIEDYKELDPQRDFRDGVRKSTEAIEATIKHGARNEGGFEMEIDDEFLPLPESFTREDIPGHGALNPTGLVAMASASGVPANKLAEAMRSVLAAWKSHLTERLPGDIIQRVRNAFND